MRKGLAKHQRVEVCCSALQCVLQVNCDATWRESVLQVCVAICCNVLQCDAKWSERVRLCHVLQGAAVYCIVLQYAAVCCSVLHVYIECVITLTHSEFYQIPHCELNTALEKDVALLIHIKTCVS